MYVSLRTFPTGYLLVSETRLTDTGLYQCHATNSAGNDTANAKVIITGKCHHRKSVTSDVPNI